MAGSRSLEVFNPRAAKAPLYCLLIPKNELGEFNGDGLDILLLICSSVTAGWDKMEGHTVPTKLGGRDI